MYSPLIVPHSICHALVIWATELATDSLRSVLNLTPSFYGQSYVSAYKPGCWGWRCCTPFWLHGLTHLALFPFWYFKSHFRSWSLHIAATAWHGMGRLWSSHSGSWVYWGGAPPEDPDIVQKIVATGKKWQLSIRPCKLLPNSPGHLSICSAQVSTMHIRQTSDGGRSLSDYSSSDPWTPSTS